MTDATDGARGGEGKIQAAEQSQELSSHQISISPQVAAPLPIVTTIGQPLDVRLVNETQSAFSQPSTWTAGLALLISVVNFLWTWRKDRRAHGKSVRDDFWVRKVLFETAVQPALKLMLETSDKLPRAEDADKVKEFLNGFNADHRSIAGKLVVATVLDKNLYKEIRETFTNLEDVVNDYCGNLMQDLKCDKPEVDQQRAKAAGAISEQSLSLLESMKRYQERL